MPMPEKKEFMRLRFKVEDADDDGNTGRVKGLASTFGNIDLGLDVIERGAFKKTIKDNGGAFPKLLDHDPGQPAGYSRVEETDKGLMFESELKLYDPRVKQRYELAKLSLKYERPMGVSIGYRAIKFMYERQDGDANKPMLRRLKEIALYETSLVVFPMNEMATVTGAKAAEARLFALVQRGDYSVEELKRALAELEKERSQAASQETDPELLQSVDRLIRAMRQ